MMQGVPGVLIFSNWAFGSVFDGWDSTALFSLGIAIHIIHGIISTHWLQYYMWPFVMALTFINLFKNLALQEKYLIK